MPYIGTSPSNGVRRVHTYTATAGQTTFTGSSTEGVTLTYADTNYIDVFQNGVLLGSADYTSTSGTSVVLAQGASVSDLVVIVVYDVFSVADTVSKTAGGTFDGGVTMSSTLDVAGEVQVGVDGTTAGLIRFMDSGSVTEEATISTDANGGLTFGGNSGPGELIFKTNSGTEHMKIDSTGHVTMPKQSAFSVHKNNSAQDNISEGSDVTVTFSGEQFDQNSDFASNTFTAPVTGKYFLDASIRMLSLIHI